MGQTTNYRLKQWEDWEIPRRGEVNEILEQLDGVLAGKGEFVTGSFQGNGAMGPRTISLGFQAKLVIVGMGTQGHYLTILRGVDEGGNSIDATGFTVTAASSNYQNKSGYTYYYIALR